MGVKHWFSGFILLLVTLSAAQTDRAFDQRVADIRLLTAKPVQRDIGISEAQRARMNQFANENRARITAYEKELQAAKKPADPARVEASMQVLKNEVLAQLSASQLKRLRELTLQRLGVTALTDDQVARRVGMNQGQVKKMRAAYEQGRAAFGAVQKETLTPILKPYEHVKPKSQAEADQLKRQIDEKISVASKRVQPRLAVIGKQTDTRMLGILTPSQKAVWKALLGKPFRPS